PGRCSTPSRSSGRSTPSQTSIRPGRKAQRPPTSSWRGTAGPGGGCDPHSQNGTVPMNIDLTDTTTGAINEALRNARVRLGGMASGMVLTLVIVTDEAAQYDAVRAASTAGREHPCRIVVAIIRKPDATSR